MLLQNAPWLIGAMDILGSPAQLFSLLYGSLADLLTLPARNMRLALAYARGAAPASAAEPALGEGLPPPGMLRAAALVAALSSSSLRVAADATYALAAAGRRSVAAIHQCAPPSAIMSLISGDDAIRLIIVLWLHMLEGSPVRNGLGPLIPFVASKTQKDKRLALKLLKLLDFAPQRVYANLLARTL